MACTILWDKGKNKISLKASWDVVARLEAGRGVLTGSGAKLILYQ